MTGALIGIAGQRVGDVLAVQACQGGDNRPEALTVLLAPDTRHQVPLEVGLRRPAESTKQIERARSVQVITRTGEGRRGTAAVGGRTGKNVITHAQNDGA